MSTASGPEKQTGPEAVLDALRGDVAEAERVGESAFRKTFTKKYDGHHLT